MIQRIKKPRRVSKIFAVGEASRYIIQKSYKNNGVVKYNQFSCQSQPYEKPLILDKIIKWKDLPFSVKEKIKGIK